jgi:hypothetical protein
MDTIGWQRRPRNGSIYKISQSCIVLIVNLLGDILEKQKTMYNEPVNPKK